MGGRDAREDSQRIPTYKAPEGTAWYHFLHGNVPGYQIDFMYRPAVPQGLLTRQHFGHLSRLIMYIEPHTNNPYAFAIGNLSRDDVQHEPGHGGVALIFGFRIEGVTDHAGRRDPPFAHGIATIDRHLDSATLFAAARSFYEHLFSRSKHENPSTVLYQEYVRVATQKPEALPMVLKAYVEDFHDLSTPRSSALTLKWIADESAQPKRVVIVHPNDAPFDILARCAARIAAMLYQSGIKWSAITNGRESDLPNGVSIRLVAKRDATVHESGGLVLPIGEVPEEEAEIATQLFKAQPAQRIEPAAPVQGWRARLKAQSTSTSAPPPPMAPDSGGEAVPIPGAPISGDRDSYRPRTEPRQDPIGDSVMPGKDHNADPADTEPRVLRVDRAAEQSVSNVLSTPPRSRLWIWLGLGLVAVAALIGVLAMRQEETDLGITSGSAPSAGSSATPSTTEPTSLSQSPSAPQRPSQASSAEAKDSPAPTSTPSATDAPPPARSSTTSEQKPIKGAKKRSANNGSTSPEQPSAVPTVEPRPTPPSSKSGTSVIDKPAEF